MKVRVLKEMPFAKVGEVFEIEDGIEFGSFRMGYTSEFIPLFQLIKECWLEEVKKDSLLDKFFGSGVEYLCMEQCKELAQIAKDHYIEVFDMAYRNIGSVKSPYTSAPLYKIIKNAIEQG